jgi:hypothetical protein
MDQDIDRFEPDIASYCARVRARSRFFEILDRECPAVLRELRQLWSRPFQLRLKVLRTSWHKAPREPASADETDWLGAMPSDENDVHGLLAFGRAAGNTSAEYIDEHLRSWAQKYHLDQDWVMDAAITTMSAWEAAPDHADELSWVQPGTGIYTPIPDEEMEFRFTVPQAWDVLHGTRGAAAKRITAAFKARLNEWLDSTEALAKERGLPKVARKQKEGQHLRWLAQYQVLGKSYPQIARAELLPNHSTDGRKAAAQGVASAAELIDLPLRPPTGIR